MNWWPYLDLPVTLGTCKSVSHEPSTKGQAGLKDGAICIYHVNINVSSKIDIQIMDILYLDLRIQIV